MKTERFQLHIPGEFAAGLLLALAISMLAVACQSSTAPQAQPSQPGAAPTKEWYAWQYSTFPKVWASINGTINPLSLLTISQRPDLPNLEPYGYMATSPTDPGIHDPGGQGRLQLLNSNCNFYVYQKSHTWEFGADTISTCARNTSGSGCENYDTVQYKSSVGTMKNCPMKILTLGGDITVKGTIVTIVEYPDPKMGVTLVIVHEGAVDVTSAQTGTVVTIEQQQGQGQAAYFAAPQATTEEAQVTSAALTDLYGFPPEKVVTLENSLLPPLITDLQAIPQIQRANVVVYGEGAIVPLGDATFMLSLRSPEYGLQEEQARSLATGLSLALDWTALPPSAEYISTTIAYHGWMGAPDPNSDASPPAYTATLYGVAKVDDMVAAADLAQLGYLFEDLRVNGYDLQRGVAILQDVFNQMGYPSESQLTIAYDSEDAQLLEPLASYFAGQLSAAELSTTTLAADFTYYEGQVVQEKLNTGSPVLLLTYY